MIQKKEKLASKALGCLAAEEKLEDKNEESVDSRITRFKKTAPTCGICYNQIEKQV